MLKKIRGIVNRYDKEAEIILFGSRARGDNEDDSDWDILIITSFGISWEMEKQLRKELYLFELDFGDVLSILFISRTEWDSDFSKITPFHRNVIREGVRA